MSLCNGTEARNEAALLHCMHSRDFQRRPSAGYLLAVAVAGNLSQKATDTLQQFEACSRPPKRGDQ